MKQSPFTPQHEAYLRQIYAGQAERDAKLIRAGRLFLACAVLVPAIAAGLYQLFSN